MDSDLAGVCTHPPCDQFYVLTSSFTVGTGLQGAMAGRCWAMVLMGGRVLLMKETVNKHPLTLSLGQSAGF